MRAREEESGEVGPDHKVRFFVADDSLRAKAESVQEVSVDFL